MSTETLKFHFYSLRFKPYKNVEENYDSSSILKEVVTYLMKELQSGNGYLIDKNRNRENEGSRELFMTNAVFMHRERRIRCSLALLRTGRTPKIKPIDEFKLVPIKTIGTVAEETHFFIDFSNDYGVICIEYNFYGPRITDVEYYLRNVARDKLKLSKHTDISLYMNNTIDKTLNELKNVLNMQIKIEPSKIVSSPRLEPFILSLFR